MLSITTKDSLMKWSIHYSACIFRKISFDIITHVLLIKLSKFSKNIMIKLKHFLFYCKLLH